MSAESKELPFVAQETATTSHRRLATNLVGQLAGFALTIGIGIWFTPYLIRHLGAESFGLVPLATTFANYLLLFTTALTNSLTRFLVIEVERGNQVGANRVFNTSLFGGIALGIGLLVPVTALTLLGDGLELVKAPPGQQSSASWLFFLTITGFLLTVGATPYSVASWVRNRLDLRTMGDGLYNLTRVLVVVVFFSLTTPQLWHVGVGLLVAAVLLAVYSKMCSSRLIPFLRVNPADASARTFGELYSASSWLMIDRLGDILYGGVDLWMTNRILGAAASGQYAIALQWGGLMRNFGTTLTSVIAPSTVIHFARNDSEEMMNQALKVMRLAGICVAMPVGILAGLAGPILRLWVGPQFESLATVMQLVLFPTCLIVCAAPLVYVLMAMNAVRVPAVGTIFLGGLSVLLIYVLAKPYHMHGIAIASGVIGFLKNAVLLPWYTSRKVGHSPWRYFGVVLQSAVMAGGIAVLAHGLGSVTSTASWFHLAAIGGVVLMFFGVFAYLAILTSPERQLVSRVAARLKAELWRADK